MIKGHKRRAETDVASPLWVSKAPRHSNPPRETSSPSANTVAAKIPEWEEDPGRTESQHLLALSKILHKPKQIDKAIQEFRNKVEGDQRDLEKLLKQKEDDIVHANIQHQCNVAAKIAKAFKKPPADSRGKKPDGSHTRNSATVATVPTSHPDFEYASRVIELSRGLVSEYETISTKVRPVLPEQDRSIIIDWQNHFDNTVRLLGIGHKLALRDVGKVLNLNEGNENEKVKNTENEDESGVGNAFPRVKASRSVGLMSTLQYAERGVKRMAKGLPLDEGV